MKSLPILVAVAGLLIASVAEAHREGGGGGIGACACGGGAPTGAARYNDGSPFNLQHGWQGGPVMSKKMRALLTLRDEGLKLQKADGGKLTPEHYAYLQTKLDAIQSRSH